MTAAAAGRRRLTRPAFTPRRERHLRVIDGGDQAAALDVPAAGRALCFECDWTPGPGTSSAIRSADDHTRETGHVTLSRYRN